MVGLERSNLILLEGALTSKEDKALRDAVLSNRGLIHFSTKDKVGINPRSDFNTPIGVYGYLLTKYSYHCVAKKPWDESHIRGTKLNRLSGTYEPTEYSVTTRACGFDDFATTRKFVHVVEVAKSVPDKRILWIGYDDSKSITDDKFVEFLNILIHVALNGVETKGISPGMLSHNFVDIVAVARPPGNPNAVLDAAFHGVKQRSQQASAKLWSLTYKASKSPVTWNKMLRAFGFDAVFDNGTGTIHFNEPAQAVILKPGAADRVYSALNPLSSFRLPLAAGIPAEVDADFATAKSKNYFYPPIYRAFHEMLMAKMDKTSKDFKRSVSGLYEPLNPVVLNKRRRYAEKRLNSDLVGEVSWASGLMRVDSEVDKSRIEYYVSLSEMSDKFLALRMTDLRVSFDEEDETMLIGSLTRSFIKFKLSRPSALYDIVDRAKGEDVATKMLTKYIVRRVMQPIRLQVPKAAFRGESGAIGKLVHAFAMVVKRHVEELVDALKEAMKDLPKDDMSVFSAEIDEIVEGPDSLVAHLFKL